MFDALYTNGLFSVKIQRFIDAIVQDETQYQSNKATAQLRRNKLL